MCDAGGRDHLAGLRATCPPARLSTSRAPETTVSGPADAATRKRLVLYADRNGVVAKLGDSRFPRTLECPAQRVDKCSRIQMGSSLNIRSLGLSGAFTVPDALRAMKGHVLATGEVVGIYTQNPDVAKTLGVKF